MPPGAARPPTLAYGSGGGGGPPRAGVSLLGVASLAFAALAVLALAGTWAAHHRAEREWATPSPTGQPPDEIVFLPAVLLYCLTVAIALVGGLLGLIGVLRRRKPRRLAAWALAANVAVVVLPLAAVIIETALARR